MKKAIRILVATMLIIALLPVGVFAASRPYKDVNKKNCKSYYKTINEYARNGGLKNVVKGDYFHPFKAASYSFTVNALKHSLEERYELDAKKIIPPEYLALIGNSRETATHDWNEKFLKDVAAYGYGMDIMYPKEATAKRIKKLEAKEPTKERLEKIKKLKKKLKKLKKRGREIEDRGCTICDLKNWEDFIHPEDYETLDD